MADGQVVVDFSAQCLADTRCEWKCFLTWKENSKEIQEELSSAKLIIKLEPTEGNAN
jgi:hypothetical protein